jgi:hypothetical protein
MVRGRVALPRDFEPPGLLESLVSSFPAGLIPLNGRRTAGQRHVTIPARYVSIIRDGGGVEWMVADLTALTAAGAILNENRVVEVPPPPAHKQAHEMVRDYLIVSRARAVGTATPEQRAGLLFWELTGVPAQPDGSHVSAWAEGLGARFRMTTPADLRRLSPGAVTPVIAEDGIPILALGTERIDYPLLLTLDGDPAESRPDQVQLLLDDQRGLAQVDLNVPGHVIVDVRWAPGEVPNEPRPHYSLSDVERRVADELLTTGAPVPNDLGSQLSRRFSTISVGRMRAVAASDSLIRTLAQNVRAPIDPLAQWNELFDRVSRHLADIESQIPADQARFMLDVVLAETPEWIDDPMSPEVIRSIAFRMVTQYTSLRMAFGAQGSQPNTDVLHDADSATGERDDQSDRRFELSYVSAPGAELSDVGQRIADDQSDRRSELSYVGQRIVQRVVRQAQERLARPERSTPGPVGPRSPWVVPFEVLTSDGTRIGVFVVRPPATPDLVSSSLTRLLKRGFRGFLVLTDPQSANAYIYRYMVLMHGLRVVEPAPDPAGATVQARARQSRRSGI